MISFALFSALSAFYFTMFFTPGPNNAMLTASGMKFGFVRTLPHLIGIPLGHIFQIGLTCFGLANLFLIYPQIQFYMKILCFIYLIYLGWRMIGSFSMVQQDTGRPLKFYEASLFQFINPKLWAFALSASAGFSLDGSIFLKTSYYFILFASLNFMVCSFWLAFGSYVSKYLKKKIIWRCFMCLMAIFLLFSGYLILIQ